MSDSFEERRLEVLIHLLLDGDLPDGAAAELAGMLRESAAARRHYRHALAVHNSLIRLVRSEEERPAFVPANVVALGVPGRQQWRRRIAMAAAACVVLAGGLGVLVWKDRPVPLAVLSGMTSASWMEPLELQHGFFPGRPLDLTGGFAEITYRSGVKVVLEAPCRFEVTGDHSMNVTRGRASVKVPKGHSGFNIDTPSGRLTDLGTEFGVSVGSGAEGHVVLSEVFDGEIEVPGSNVSRQRLKRGEATGILRGKDGTTRLIATVEDQPVSLVNPARRLPEAKAGMATEQGVNLALGKPVFSPSYWAGRSGESFPPDNLTDGRLNDSGSPGDWSFWLAPNRIPGEFTVDLLEPQLIGRIDLQNTRNRNHADRGMRGFTVLVSDDNREFREVGRGELARVTELPPPGTDIPFESIRVGPVTARYVKVVCSSYYRNESRPVENPNEGGGLNEIRIFAP